MEDKMVIGFTGKVTPQKPVNDQMTLCKCYVMALGKNQNKTNITKEASDKALPSLYNVPVVGHIMTDEDNSRRMGGHDMSIDRSEDGKLEINVLTVPYGVVPLQDNVHYEEVEDEDGEVQTYLVADVILWTGRYPELLDTSYSKDVYFAQSMEIIPSKTTREDDYLTIDEYQYSALCLLGKSDDADKNIEPCFKNARVEPYEFTALTNKLPDLYEEFKKELARCYEDILLEKQDNIANEINAADDGNVEELVEANDELQEGDNEEVVLENDNLIEEDDPIDNDSDEENAVREEKKFSVEFTYEERRKRIADALAECSIWTEDEYVGYCLLDFDSNYAYCVYRHASIESPEVIQTVRIPYHFDDEAILLSLDEAEKVRSVWVTKEEEEKISAKTAEFEALLEYKKQRVEDDRRKEYGTIIDDFKDLGEVDEYRETVKNAMTFETADALREKLYAIRGKYMKPVSKKPIQQIRIPVGYAAKETKSELDEFMSKYLPNKK